MHGVQGAKVGRCGWCYLDCNVVYWIRFSLCTIADKMKRLANYNIEKWDSIRIVSVAVLYEDFGCCVCYI